MNENKKKFALYMKPESFELVKDLYKKDDCRSQSEFIEKAVKFYSGYLNSNMAKDYLPNILVSTLNSIVKNSTDRINRIIFKLCVELAVSMNVTAFANDVSEADIDKMRDACRKAIKKSNGQFDFEDAMRWQNKM